MSRRVGFIIRHDREADLIRFKDDPHHGYFINKNQNKYTIMATGDDIELEDGTSDRGLGRVFYFSSPQTRNGLVLGDSNHDNARKITMSRDPINWHFGTELSWSVSGSQSILAQGVVFLHYQHVKEFHSDLLMQMEVMRVFRRLSARSRQSFQC